MGKLTFFLNDLLKKHNLTFLKLLLISLGCILIAIFTGSSYISFGASQKVKIFLYVITFIYFGVIALASFRPSLFKVIKQEKKIPIPRIVTFAFVSILLFIVLSFLFNQDKTKNINTYISFILTILVVYFVLISIKPSTILKCFKNTMFIIAVVDIVIFLFVLVSKTFFPSFYYASTKAIIGNYFFLSSDSITSLSINYFGKYRLYGFMWEPSVFGVVLVAALICDQFSKDKYTLLRTIIFTVCVICTFSLSAFILYFFYLAILITNRLKGYKPYYFVIFFLVVIILVTVFMRPIMDFLARILPSVFSKIGGDAKSTSFSTRFLSIRYYFQVFAKNPVFGFGGVTANEMYHNLRSGAVTADTSTFGSVLASYGFAGIFYIISIYAGILLNRKMEAPIKILLAFLVFLSTSSQGQSSIIGLNILYFLPLVFVSLPKKAENYNTEYYSKLENKTLKDFVLQKNDDGVVSSNILLSFVLKGISIVLAFITIPTYLNYFNSDESTYGVWLAITSILTVITVFDFGMGNGLKNRLIKNIYNKDNSDSKTIISTTYLLTSLIGLFISLIGIIVIFSLKDATVAMVFFKGKEASAGDIFTFRIGFLIVMFAIGFQFFLKNINYILQAHQKNAITGIFMLITNLSLLIFATIFADSIAPENKILFLAVAYFVFLILPLLVANLILFSSSYKDIRPSFKNVDFAKSKSVVSISLRFFIVQIGTLFIWSINEWLILFLFDFNASYITEYNEYYKLFSLFPIILGTIIQQPIWTALSKADVEGDKASIKKYIVLDVVFAISTIVLNIILSLFLPIVFNLWLGNSAPAVTTYRIITFVAYTIIYVSSISLVIICNAFSLFKSQIVFSCIGIFIKIPALILINKYLNLSWEALMLINTACYVPFLVGAPFEIIKNLKNSKNTVKGDLSL